MMHPLTISGNRHVGAQHRFKADSFKRISGGLGLQPTEAGIKTPLKTLKSIMPIYTVQVPWFSAGDHDSPWPPLD